MKVIKVAILAFVLSCVVFSGPAEGVEITPVIVSMPDLPGEIFSFDFVITDIGNLTREAQAFQAVISVSGLTGNEPGSIEVSDEPAYWLVGNSLPVFIDHGDNSYTFGDNPNNGIAQPLGNGDILARYAFTWDGTVGDYTFTIDLDTDNSFILLEDFITIEALQLPNPEPPWWSDPIRDATSNSVTVHIPEPTTLILIGMGGLVLLRKRRAQT